MTDIIYLYALASFVMIPSNANQPDDKKRDETVPTVLLVQVVGINQHDKMNNKINNSNNKIYIIIIIIKYHREVF